MLGNTMQPVKHYYVVNYLDERGIEPTYFSFALIFNWNFLYYLVSHKLSTEIEASQ